MGFIIGLLVGGAAVTGLVYVSQDADADRWPAWLNRIAAWWRFH